MKARKIKVDPDAPFGDAIRATLAVRLDELHSFDPSEPGQLHDLRIAAKRVRYILEVAEPVFGAPAKRGVKAMKRVQDVLGEIHDCDELLPLIERHTEKLRAEDAAAATKGEQLPNRRKYRGLEALRALTAARREELYKRFAVTWPKLDREQLERDLAGSGVPA